MTISNTSTAIEVGFSWNAGWDDVLIDPTSVRDLTAAEIEFHHKNPSEPWIGGNTQWLHCKFLRHVEGLSNNPSNQAVRVVERLARGD